MRCLVLGAGVVGEAVAWDLTHCQPTAEVLLADVNEARLATVAAWLPVPTTKLDVATPGALEALASDHDVIVGALPSALGFGVLERLCRLGARVCDVSFMPEPAAQLDGRARANRAVVVYDCGVAPGLSHVLAGAGAADLATVATVRIDVGGLPEQPRPPFYYKAPFAPSDVIEEYTRPARIVRNGVPTRAEPLSGAERFDVEGVGPVDSFLTDGLRSLADSIAADAMEERTLRHPGHLPLILALRAAGFFDTAPKAVGGVQVSPRDLTSALLFPHWAYAEGERDVTILRVSVSGADENGKPAHRRWSLVDRPDAVRTAGLRSMARTTGFPAAIVARWIADGSFDEVGAHAPEYLGQQGFAPRLLEALSARGVLVKAEPSAVGQP